MGFLHTLSKLVVEERKITPQRKDKQEYKDELESYITEDVEDLARKKVIEMDDIHSRGSHLIRKMEIHVKHYMLGNITNNELNNAFTEAEYGLKEQLVIKNRAFEALSEEERNRIVQVYYEKLTLLKKEIKHNKVEKESVSLL